MFTRTMTLAAVLLSVPLAAPAIGRESVSVRVSTEGLDLTKSGDVRKLRSRVRRAIDDACNPVGYLSPSGGGGRDWECYREMNASAERAMFRFADRLASRNDEYDHLVIP